MKRSLFILIAWLCASGVLCPQDLGKVTGVRTAPTTIGLTCDPALGEIVYNLANRRLYRCSATNTWSPLTPSQVFDAQDYGAIPAAFGIAQESNTATTTAGSSAITLSSAKNLQNHESAVLVGAGPLPTMTAPGAPTVSSPVLGGSATFHYQCVAADAYDAQMPGSVATLSGAPDVFAPAFAAISGASVTGNVLTVNFSGAINATAGNEIDIRGLGGPGANWNALYKVASAPNGSSVTIALTTGDAAATVSSASKGRLTNARNITAIGRAGNVITITTDAAHNYKAQTGGIANTIVTVANVWPADLNGDFVVLTASGTSITASSAIYSTETGVVTPGSSSASVNEFVTVTCPDPAGTTQLYYVYGDSRDSGVTMTYLGATMNSQKTFTDWGPLFASGPAAPPNVSAGAPPVGPVRQNLPVTVLSGAGTTTLNVSPVVPASGTFKILHDQAPGFRAALSAASAQNGGMVFLSPDTTSTSRYVFNSPVTIPLKVDVLVGAEVVANSTMMIGYNNACNGGVKILGVAGPGYSTGAFAQTNYQLITGSAKTFLQDNSGCELTLKNLEFQGTQNGQNFVVLQSTLYTQFSDLFFADMANNNYGGTSSGITVNGGGSSQSWSNIGSVGYSPIGQGGVPSLGPLTYISPLIGPMFWFKGCDNASNNAWCQPGLAGSFTLSGQNQINGRGFLFDRTFATGSCQNYTFENNWDQAPVAPWVNFYGNNGFACGPIRISRNLIDTSPMASFANLSTSLQGPVILEDDTTSAWPVGGFGMEVTGNVSPNLVVYGTQSAGLDTIGQNVSLIVPWSGLGTGAQTYFGGSSTPSAFSNAFSFWGVPFHMQAPFFFEPAPITTLVSTGATSGGSVPAGIHSWCIAAVSWNGAWGPCSNYVTLTVAGGTQTVPLTWSGLDGAAGYQVFRDNKPCDTAASLNYTTNLLTYTDTAASCSGVGNQPSVAGFGTPAFDSSGVTANQLRLVNGQKIATLDVDLLSNVRLDGAIIAYPTARDNFNRADGALGANWGGLLANPAIAGNQVTGGSTSQLNVGYWVGGGTFPDGIPQSAQVEIASTQAAVTTIYMGPGVYISAGMNGYFCFTSATQPALSIWKYVSVTNGFGGPTVTSGASLIVSATTARQHHVGDVVSLSAAPSADQTSVTLTCSVPGLGTISGTDSSSPILTGKPGFAVYNSNAAQAIDNWKAWTVVRGPLTASLVTTAAASDAVAIPGMLASYHCQLTPTNAAAATNVATTYISAKTTDQITVSHAVTASMNYDVSCSP